MNLESEEELQKMLEDNPGLQEMEEFETEWEPARVWIEISSLSSLGQLDMTLSEGREFYSIDEIRDLSIRYNVDEAQILRCLRAETRPCLIEMNRRSNRHPSGTPSDNSPLGNKYAPSLPVTQNESSRHTELEDAEEALYDARGERRRIRMAVPRIRGHVLLHFEELRRIVETEFPGLSRNPHYQDWLQDAQKHFQLYQFFIANPDISPEQLRAIARKLGLSRGKGEGWIHQEKLPQIYGYIEQALSRKEGLRLQRHLKKQLNGATNYDSMKRKLASFFLEQELKHLDGHQMHQGNAEAFYTILDLLQEGGLVKDLAREAQTSRQNVTRWMQGDLPRYPRIASEIPSQAPGKGYKWLPKKISGKSFEDWMEVPEGIDTFEQIRSVLRELESLSSKQMESWEKQYGPMTKEEALGYTLGVICSDGYFYRKSMNERFGIELSRKYTWSKHFGEGVCYSLGKLGIKAGRISDRADESVPRMVWISESSPVLNWTKRAVLGFRMQGSKSSLNVPWIETAPEPVLRGFVQGLADGDGYVSATRTGISTKTESQLYSRVLKKLDIQSKANRTRASILAKADIQKAAQLPLFRYALGRQQKLENLAKMYEKSSHAGHMSVEEKRMIRNLKKEGLSTGEIRMEIWDRLAVSRSAVAIWRYLKTLKQKDEPIN